MAGKTTLTKERLKIILELYKEGATWRTIADKIGVTEQTLYKWRDDDTLEIYTSMERIRREKLLKKAEQVMEELLESDDGHIKAKMSQFLGETLGKKWYSKQETQTININLPTPILDLGKLVSTIPEKPLLNKDNPE